MVNRVYKRPGVPLVRHGKRVMRNMNSLTKCCCGGIVPGGDPPVSGCCPGIDPATTATVYAHISSVFGTLTVPLTTPFGTGVWFAQSWFPFGAQYHPELIPQDIRIINFGCFSADFGYLLGLSTYRCGGISESSRPDSGTCTPFSVKFIHHSCSGGPVYTVTIDLTP